MVCTIVYRQRMNLKPDRDIQLDPFHLSLQEESSSARESIHIDTQVTFLVQVFSFYLLKFKIQLLDKLCFGAVGKARTRDGTNLFTVQH